MKTKLFKENNLKYFNCWFCHNRKIIEDKNFENIDEKEVLDFLEKRKGLLDGLVISGGEPTLNYDLENFVKKVNKKLTLFGLSSLQM